MHTDLFTVCFLDYLHSLDTPDSTASVVWRIYRGPPLLWKTIFIILKKKIRHTLFLRKGNLGRKKKKRNTPLTEMSSITGGGGSWMTCKPKRKILIFVFAPKSNNMNHVFVKISIANLVGMYVFHDHTTVQQRGQNHHSRAMVNRSSRIRSAMATKVPSDYKQKDILRICCS